MVAWPASLFVPNEVSSCQSVSVGHSSMLVAFSSTTMEEPESSQSSKTNRLAVDEVLRVTEYVVPDAE